MSLVKPDATRREGRLLRSERLRVTEMFYSLQGESRTVGWPTCFIRLTGCPLRCRWCDTAYAFHGGRWLSLDDILEEAARMEPRLVTVTGGEPLAQPNCHRLLSRLCDWGYTVSLETSGYLPVAKVDRRVVIVMDLKAPGSGEVERNRWENLEALKPGDQVKFVIQDRRDYAWAKKVIRGHSLTDRFEVLISPVFDTLDAAELAGWILEDKLQVRFQLQLHKQLWGDLPGR